MLGTARTEAELQELVSPGVRLGPADELAERRRIPIRTTFAHLDGRAVERIADVVLPKKREDEVGRRVGPDEGALIAQSPFRAPC